MPMHMTMYMYMCALCRVLQQYLTGSKLYHIHKIKKKTSDFHDSMDFPSSNNTLHSWYIIRYNTTYKTFIFNLEDNELLVFFSHKSHKSPGHRPP